MGHISEFEQQLAATVEREAFTKPYRVLKLVPDTERTLWHEVGELSSANGGLSPQDIGRNWGEGRYLYFNADRKYPTLSSMTVVAEASYRAVDDLESGLK